MSQFGRLWAGVCGTNWWCLVTWWSVTAHQGITPCHYHHTASDACDAWGNRSTASTHRGLFIHCITPWPGLARRDITRVRTGTQGSVLTGDYIRWTKQTNLMHQCRQMFWTGSEQIFWSWWTKLNFILSVGGLGALVEFALHKVYLQCWCYIYSLISPAFTATLWGHAFIDNTSMPSSIHSNKTSPSNDMSTPINI